MSQSTQELKSISWKDMCPWLILFKSIGIALRPEIVIISFIGLLVTPLGWSVSETFLAHGDRIGEELTSENQESWIPIRSQIALESHWNDTFRADNWMDSTGPHGVFSKFYRGHIQILNPQLNIRQFLYFFSGTIWMLLIWSFLGTMICRIAATHFARDERIGIFEAFGFVRKRLFSVWTSSVVPLVLIMLFIIPLFFVGLIMRLDFLLVLVGIGWFVVVILGLMMAIVLIPLFFGFPLLWPAIATEGSDAFESISRSYAYPTQKPYHYVFYWIAILLIGFFASFVASTLSTKTIEFTRWGTSWGATTERILEIQQGKPANQSGEPIVAVDPPSADQQEDANADSLLGISSNIIRFWEQGVIILALGFNYGFFFVAMSGMYLLLRRDNDFSEIDEILLEEIEDQIPLPPVESSRPPLPAALEDPEPVEPDPPIQSPADSKTSADPPSSNSSSLTQPAQENQVDDDDGELRVEED